jgi:hypothetical protein
MHSTTHPNYFSILSTVRDIDSCEMFANRDIHSILSSSSSILKRASKRCIRGVGIGAIACCSTIQLDPWELYSSGLNHLSGQEKRSRRLCASVRDRSSNCGETANRLCCFKLLPAVTVVAASWAHVNHIPWLQYIHLICFNFYHPLRAILILVCRCILGAYYLAPFRRLQPWNKLSLLRPAQLEWTAMH